MSSPSSSSQLPPQQQVEKTTVPKDWITVMPGQTPSKYSDPCAHAAKASMKCLEANRYDGDKCSQAFEEYRECKKKWVLQRRADRASRREGAYA